MSYAETIVLQKTAKQIAADPYLRSRVATVAEEKDSKLIGTNKTQPNIQGSVRKLDEYNDAGSIPTVSLTVSKAIQQARLAKGLTQKDLGVKINEKQTMINDYESGKAIPNVQILGKMERILGVKLRGKEIGSELKKN
jgi:putative transcription factor